MTEISKQVGLTTSTTHRLLASMESHGLLNRAADERRYQLGYRFLHWAAVVEKGSSLQQQARPILESLSKETGETAVLMVRDKEWAVCIDRIDSSQSLRLAMTVGQRIPLHAGSSAKILLAYLDSEELKTVVELNKLLPIGQNTITDPAKLTENLQQIREQGYAISFQERDPGAAGLTAPVFNQAHQIVAGLGIVGPVSRLTIDLIEHYRPLVLSYAESLSRLQGFTP